MMCAVDRSNMWQDVLDSLMVSSQWSSLPSLAIASSKLGLCSNSLMISSAVWVTFPGTEERLRLTLIVPSRRRRRYCHREKTKSYDDEDAFQRVMTHFCVRNEKKDYKMTRFNDVEWTNWMQLRYVGGFNTKNTHAYFLWRIRFKKLIQIYLLL